MTGDPVDVRVPGDKSITHRALILAALADGESRLAGLLDAADTRATAAVLRNLGADVPPPATDPVRVAGKGVAGLAAPGRMCDCGNSGTTARLILGLLAGCPFDAIVTGDDSLRGRPMRRVIDPLAAAGAVFRELEGHDRLPVAVRGARPLRPIAWRSPVASAQVKSALLLAGLAGRTPVDFEEPAVSRDHTERMLRAMGAPVDALEDPTGHTLHLAPPDRLDPLDIRVPGDISSAAFFLGLGALAGAVRVTRVGLNPGRTGALRVMERMGAVVTVTEQTEVAGEPVGEVVVSAGQLRGTRVRAEEVSSLIDEVPLLAVMAARAEGETRFDGVAELRVKESDRIATLDENLRRLGVPAEAGPDHLVVMGGGAPLDGTVDSRGDHRVAMAFGVLGALAGNRIVVRGHDAVAVSFPGFWELLEQVGKEITRP